MSILKAVILAVVQGIAEFLPISSSGHLAIAKYLLKVETDTGILYDVLLHLGTLIAIFIAFRKDIKELIVEGLCIVGLFFKNLFITVSNLFVKEKKNTEKIITTPYRRFVMLIIISTIPTGILGILFKDVIEKASAGIIVPGIMLLVTGGLIFFSERMSGGNLGEADYTYPKALVVGTIQGFATLPGLSRSGSTIAALLLTGAKREFAVKYSFIMSIPAVLGAVVFEITDINPGAVQTSEILIYLLGMVIAAGVGFLCIKTMLVVIKSRGFKYFAYYCFAVGLFALVAGMYF